MALGPIDVTIKGGLRALSFIKGNTTSAQWRAAARAFPAPWAELGSDRFIITLPSSYMRALADPQAVVDLYEKYADAYADLSGVSSAYCCVCRAAESSVPPGLPVALKSWTAPTAQQAPVTRSPTAHAHLWFRPPVRPRPVPPSVRGRLRNQRRQPARRVPCDGADVVPR